MRAVVTVAGTDKIGIIASATGKLAELNVNILDITQTILPPNFFTMVMLVDASESPLPFGEIADQMEALGKEGEELRGQAQPQTAPREAPRHPG